MPQNDASAKAGRVLGENALGSALTLSWYFDGFMAGLG